MDHLQAEIPENVWSSPEIIERARATIHQALPENGVGYRKLQQHLEYELTQGLSNSASSSRYFGFVTGGTTPAAVLADNVVTAYDQNVQVHLPDQSITTDVEYHALNMLCELIDLDPKAWKHKIFTTGATGSNIVGLACGRGFTVAKAAARHGKHDVSVARQGLLSACLAAGVEKVQILTTVPHSSIRKAAAVIGLGHEAVIDCSREGAPSKFDVSKLREQLEAPRTASIIMISACEVNSGMFATSCRGDMEELRQLADEHGAWIHVDAAMGFMARLLPSNSYRKLRDCVDGLELADSITGDGHKLLNVPYDTGFLLSRHLDVATQVFQNPGAVYLSSGADSIPSPLNIGLENSRRFRALPVYANLVTYGRKGYEDMIVRQVELARTIAGFLYDHDEYEVYIPESGMTREQVLDNVFMIVLFRAKKKQINEVLVQQINSTRRMYCSGTQWQGQKAARIAVSNWKADVDRDWVVVKEVLRATVNGQ